MNNNFSRFILVATLLALCHISARALTVVLDADHTYFGMRFRFSNDSLTATLVRSSNHPSQERVIPDTVIDPTGIFPPAPVVAIGDGAVRGQSPYTVVIPKTVKYIGKEAFSFSALRSVNIPDGVKLIDFAAFRNCEELKNVDFQGRVDSIARFVFINCKLLGEVVLPSGLKYIPDYLFSTNYCLSRIVIPEGVTHVDLDFLGSNGTSLIEIVSLSAVPPIISSNNPYALDSFKRAIGNCYLFVPIGSESAYRSAYGWKLFHRITDVSFPTQPDNGMAPVYDIHGALVSQGMRLDDMKRCLPKGVYVTNGRKVAIP